MNVLFVCHRFPYPPIRGGKIRPFNIIRHLAGYARVTVASLVRSEEERRAGEGLAEHCHRFFAESVGPVMALGRMVARIPTPSPSSFGYFYSPALARRIKVELARDDYDLVFVHCSSVAPYVASYQESAKFLDYGDMDSEKWSMYATERPFPISAGYRLESVKLRRVERQLAGQFDLCTCTTTAELESLRALGTARQTGWFPNGVDIEFFQPPTEAADPNLVCFSGRMDYFPNQQAVQRFCASILPLIRERRPATKFSIIGADPPPSIRRLAGWPGVIVTGTVKDVRPYVQRAAVSVAPLDVARGTQNKILEAMAMGVPVVCSSLAARGVDAVPGEHLLIADTPAHFAQRVCELLDLPDRRATLSRAGRARVISHHSWASSLRRMDGYVEQCLPRVARAGGAR